MKRWTSIFALFLGLVSSTLWADTQPPMSSATILVWANEAIVKVYSYDYVNYGAQLQGVSDYFTVDAWHAYSDSLAKSKMLDSVQANKLTVSAVALKPPVIKDTKGAGSTFQWTVEMPTLVNFDSSANLNKQQKLNVQLVIVTAQAPQGVRGLAIQSFLAKPMDAK